MKTMLLLTIGIMISAKIIFAQTDAFETFLISSKSHEDLTEIVERGIFNPASNIKTIYPNKTILIAFGVNNPYIAPDKSVDILFDVKVLKPDQTILFDLPEYTKISSATNSRFLSNETLDLTLESSDPEGNYTIIVLARDLGSGNRSMVKGAISLKKERGAGVVASMDDFNLFMTYYYQNKNETLIIPALEYLLGQENFLKSNGTHVKPIVHFFAALVQNNPSVLEEIKMLGGRYTGISRTVISDILQEATNFVSPEPKTAKDMDFLWSEFMATGNDAPIIKITGTLSMNANEELLINTAAAEWSLVSNGIQHSKVYHVIKSEFSKSTGKQKEKLLQVLQKIKAQRKA